MGCNSSSTTKAGDAKQENNAPDNRDKDKKQAKQENNDFQQTMDFLGKVKLMKSLPKDKHPLVATICIQKAYKEGETVIEEGTTGDAFFLIKSGEATVTVKNQDGNGETTVASLKMGDYFGENALLRDEPRTATIKAKTSLQCLMVLRKDFFSQGLNDNLRFANRKAVAAGNVKQLKVKPADPKTPADRKFIEDALKKNENLNTMVSLDAARCSALIDKAWKENVPKGEELIVEGDLNADYFYVVQEGKFEIYIQESESGGAGTEEYNQRVETNCVSTVVAGGSFGELALLYLVPRAATVKAIEASVVWVVDRKNFKEVLMQVSTEKIKEYCKYLEKVDILNPLLNDERRQIAEALIEMHFTKGEVILQQGEPGNTFYILYEGEVVVEQNGQQVQKLYAKASQGNIQVFGEKALLNNEKRAASIIVSSETAKALALDQETFNLLLGPLSDINPSQDREKKGASAKDKMLQQCASGGDRTRIFRKDLKKIGLLGCGGFGTVELFEHAETKETYALKGLSKGYVVKTGMQESVMNEKNILMMTNSIFIIKCYETFNGTQTLYFLLEPALGGELYATYNRKGLHGSEKHAKFYIAGVVFAFEHCHERRIIYRDLKPENLLLTSSGGIKLTDMGLAKFVIGKTYTTCGTPDYFAPEIIASTGHTVAVDWWTLGVLLFELLSGHPPFESAYPMQIYSKVMKGINKIPFPAKCLGKPEAIIKGLLHKEPSQRLPMKTGGTKNMKECEWYKDFDWVAMSQMKLESPYKPIVKSKKDIANFSARKEDMPKQMEYKDDGSGWGQV